MPHWTVEEAQQNFALLIQGLREGETFVLSQDGEAIGQIEPLSRQQSTVAAEHLRVTKVRDQRGASPAPQHASIVPSDDRGTPAREMPLSPPTTDPPYSQIRLGALAGRFSIPDDWKSIGMDDWEAHFDKL